MKHRVKHIHFVGIGGVGMCGIAEVLLNLGYSVSGSDMADGAATQRLAAQGARVFFGHDATYMEGADVVVTSTAVKADNPEVLCVDDPNVREIRSRITKPVTTYGLDDSADIYAENVVAASGQMHFDVVVNNGQRQTFPVVLNLPGRHNVLNALSAIAIGLECGADIPSIQRGLAEFAGVGRRFQRYGEVALPAGGSFTLVDDYGHHPVEMAATLSAVRGAFPDKRLVLAFQPHRYSRTRDLFEDFVKVLNGVDALLLSEVYAAGEAPIVAADGRALARAVRVSGKVEPLFVEQIADMPRTIMDIACDGDVVITMGAGSIGAVPGKLVAGKL